MTKGLTEWLSLELDSSDNESQEEDPEVYTLTAYILVERNIPQPQRGSRPPKIPEAEKYMQRGPIDFKSTDRYASFLVKISRALPCPVLNIVEEKLTWKPQTPKNATALLLGGETGFSAMVRSFRNAKKACMVMIMMPPPTRPINEKPVRLHTSRQKLTNQCSMQNWSTGDEAMDLAEEFPYSELEVRSSENHVVEQRVSHHFLIIISYLLEPRLIITRFNLTRLSVRTSWHSKKSIRSTTILCFQANEFIRTRKPAGTGILMS
jgi:hypothetical protein